ncbi:MAG: hypothetical protein AB8G05_24480 [Oligoflexales bacterium]
MNVFLKTKKLVSKFTLLSLIVMNFIFLLSCGSELENVNNRTSSEKRESSINLANVPKVEYAPEPENEKECSLRINPFNKQTSMKCGEKYDALPFPKIKIEVIADLNDLCEADTITHLRIGLDANQNLELDNEEVTHNEYHCDPTSIIPPAYLMLKEELSSPSQCESGSGFVLKSGLDLNRNNILDEDELEIDQTICDGSSGEQGEQGERALTEL